MSNQNNKTLLVVRVPEYSYDHFDPMLTQIEEHFKRILRFLEFSTTCGKKISIKLNIDLFNPEKISAYAKQLGRDESTHNYEIMLTAGFSYHLWGISRVFLSDYIDFPWIDQCQVVEGQKLSSYKLKELMADYAYFLSSYFILLHEISHIVLGHLDFMDNNDNMNNKMGSAIKKSFEAEADRQAGELLAIFFDLSLVKDRLGNYLQFPSKLHAYEFYIHTITNLFRLTQDLTDNYNIHPKPNERLYIILGSLDRHFERYYPNERTQLYLHSLQACMDAGKKFSLIDAYEPLTIMLNAQNLAFVDNIIQQTNLRAYQHQIKVKEFNN